MPARVGQRALSSSPAAVPDANDAGYVLRRVLRRSGSDRDCGQQGVSARPSRSTVEPARAAPGPVPMAELEPCVVSGEAAELNDVGVK